VGKSAKLSPTAAAATDALALGLALYGFLADYTAGSIERRMAATGAEGAAWVVGGLRKLGAAFRMAAEDARLVACCRRTLSAS
jgi:hypothetical protein